jgi:NAD(P)-dependent dehydrogenase (short-subunit alcohol dehydrogenase family)
MAQSIIAFKSDQVVLVTAGASGIGLCMAESYLKEGCKVHICDIDEGNLTKFLSDHPTASGTITDISQAQQVAEMFSDIEQRYGKLDILVNNAGIAGPTAAVEDININDWDKTIAVDLNGPFYVTNKAVPLLKKAGGGSIINIASNAALFGFPLRSAYTAAKWAIIGLTKTWAMELGPHNIRVNALCPCSVNGPRIEQVIEKDAQERGVSNDEIRTVYQRQSSMRLFVDAQDVANMAIFLSSDLGKTVSGQSIAVDGHTEGLSNWLD